jgi:hypothetical protein
VGCAEGEEAVTDGGNATAPEYISMMSKKYGHIREHHLDTSPLILDFENVCTVQDLPTNDRVHFLWSETEKDLLKLVAIGYRSSISNHLKTPRLDLRNWEYRVMPREDGREIFKYLIEEKGWML